MITHLLRALCDHEGIDLALNTVAYNTEEITCTAIDRQIICAKCGTVLINNNQFQAVVDLIIND